MFRKTPDIEPKQDDLTPDEVLGALEQDNFVTDGEEDTNLKFVRRSMRIANYSVVVCLVVVMLFAWISSHYVIRLETQFSEKNAEVYTQLNSRVGKIENLIRPKPTPPQFVDFTVPATAPRLGNAQAKVTIVEFSDFQCPFCSRFQQLVYPQLKLDYIDTGKASFVYQDFAFLGEESKLAGQAAKCAGEQQKFWEYHDHLFEQQKGENEGAFSVKNLKTFARTLKLNTSAFGTCLDSGKYLAAVEAETASGRNMGITGTPTVLVNGKIVVGAQPYDVFKQAIEEALAK